MLVIDKIEKTKFSSSEQAALDYILSQGYDIADLTLNELASQSFSSPATFVRLAKRLGFKGWSEFKKEYLKEIAYFHLDYTSLDLNIPFDNTDTVLTLADKITEIKKNALSDTVHLLSPKTFSKASTIFYKAEQIKIFASNINLLLAQEFQFKMNRIGKPVFISSLEGEHIYDILNMKKGEVALVISYSGSSPKMQEIMKTLNQRKIPIVAITGLTDNILSQQADVTLYMATREKLYSKVGQYSTNTSVLHLLDLLYSSIFAKNFEENLQHIITCAKIANYRQATAKIMEEITSPPKFK